MKYESKQFILSLHYIALSFPRNLQSAINCFLEVQWNTQVLPNMGFKQHLTMAEAVNYVLPNTWLVLFWDHLMFYMLVNAYILLYLTLYSFTKIWQIYNNGEEKWPEGCQVVLAEGLNLSNLNSFPVPALIPGEIYEIRVNMISPQKPGLYESRWMMANPQGSFFGGRLQNAVIYYVLFLPI